MIAHDDDPKSLRQSSKVQLKLLTSRVKRSGMERALQYSIGTGSTVALRQMVYFGSGQYSVKHLVVESSDVRVTAPGRHAHAPNSTFSLAVLGDGGSTMIPVLNARRPPYISESALTHFIVFGSRTAAAVTDDMLFLCMHLTHSYRCDR